VGRTVPTANQANNELIRDLAKVREGLTTDEKKLWDEFMQTLHLNERAISLAVFCDPLQSITLAMLFKQCKALKKLGEDFSESQQEPLDESEPARFAHRAAVAVPASSGRAMSSLRMISERVPRMVLLGCLSD
jgi:hypothetical protein